MKKKRYQIIFIIIILQLVFVNLVISDDFDTGESGGGDVGGEFNQESFQNALSDPDATATIPEGATYTSPAGETYEGPGEMKGGKYSGKVIPKGFANPVETKGATIKNGQITEAEEITIDGKVQKNVKNVKQENGEITFDEAEETLNDYPESAEQPSTPEQNKIVQTQAKGVTNYKKTADEETFGKVERFTATTKQGETINIINGVNVKSSSQGISSSSADSTEYEQANIVGSENFNTQLKNQFYVAKADQVIVGNKIFNNIEDSTFNLENGKIDKAEVTSSKDNNLFKLPSDIMFTDDYMTIKANKSASFDLEFIRRIYNKDIERDGMRVRLDEGALMEIYDFYDNYEHQWLEFETMDNQGTLEILENPSAYMEFKHGLLTYMNEQYNAKTL